MPRYLSSDGGTANAVNDILASVKPATQYSSPWINIPGAVNTNAAYHRNVPFATNYVNTVAAANANDTAPFDPTKGVDWSKKYYEDLAANDKRSAASTLSAAFEYYGLGSLKGPITSMILEGKPSSEVSILLRQTPQYKERFPAMDILAKKGRALSEDQYISLETSYSKILSAAGLNNYFTSPNDYAHYIAKDISPEEFSSRVNTATTFVNNSNPNAVEAFKNYYGIDKTDLLKYYLDPEKATPELLKKAEIATVGGQAAAAGLGIGESFARNIADAGLSKNADQAFAKTAQTKEELAKLSTISGQDLTTQNIVEANLGMNVNAEKQVTALASQERARFSGKSAGAGMTGQNVSGSY